MKTAAGFTLLEATIAAAVLMIGIVTLITTGNTLLKQVTDIRTAQGQPEISERLLQDQISLIRGIPGTPATYPEVPPIVVGNVLYTIQITVASHSTWTADTQEIHLSVKQGGIPLPNSGTVRMTKNLVNL